MFYKLSDDDEELKEFKSALDKGADPDAAWKKHHITKGPDGNFYKMDLMSADAVKGGTKALDEGGGQLQPHTTMDTSPGPDGRPYFLANPELSTTRFYSSKNPDDWKYTADAGLHGPNAAYWIREKPQLGEDATVFGGRMLGHEVDKLLAPTDEGGTYPAQMPHPGGMSRHDWATAHEFGHGDDLGRQMIAQRILNHIEGKETKPKEAINRLLETVKTGAYNMFERDPFENTGKRQEIMDTLEPAGAAMYRSQPGEALSDYVANRIIGGHQDDVDPFELQKLVDKEAVRVIEKMRAGVFDKTSISQEDFEAGERTWSSAWFELFGKDEPNPTRSKPKEERAIVIGDPADTETIREQLRKWRDEDDG